MAYFGYKKLLSSPDFLKVRARARQLMGKGSDLIAIYYKERTLIFKTVSATTPGVVWTQKIEITDAAVEALANTKSYADVERLIKNSSLKVHCNCLAEGTQVLTFRGYVNIEDVNSDDYVLSSDCKWHKVVRVAKSELKKNWKRVKIRGILDDLIVSDDHKLLFSTYRDKCACGCNRLMRPISDTTRMEQAYSLFERRRFIPKHSKREINDDFERYQMKSLKEYKLGELLCSPVVEGDEEFDIDYARMLGYYLAEGCIPERGSIVEITLNKNERDTIAADIVSYFSRIGVKTRLKDIEYNGRKWLNVYVYSKKFREDCKYWCGRKSKIKQPNPRILSWNREAKESFLIGHLLGDGAVDDSFRWLSTSKKMVLMLQMILNSIGVHASCYVANYNTNKENRSVCYAVSCTINEFYSVYSKCLLLFREKDLCKKNNSKGQKDIDKYSLYKVLDIEDVEPRYGYDVVLADEPHNYVANNVIVSNCPAFLYWGFKYIAWKKGYGLEKETRRPRVRNPREEGYLCKHLYFVLQLYPFLAKSLASKFKNYADKKVEAQGMNSIQRMRMNRNEQRFVNQNNQEEQIKETLSQELNQS